MSNLPSGEVGKLDQLEESPPSNQEKEKAGWKGESDCLVGCA